MSPGYGVRSVLRPPILLGFAVWLILALASFAPRVHLGIIEVLFLLGPWVVVPLCADLLVPGRSPSRNFVLRPVKDICWLPPRGWSRRGPGWSFWRFANQSFC